MLKILKEGMLMSNEAHISLHAVIYKYEAATAETLGNAHNFLYIILR